MRRLIWTNLLIVSFALLIHGAGRQTDWVEEVYARQWYPALTGWMRWLTQWIPISVGDILYGFLGIWLLIRVVRFVQAYRQAHEAKSRVFFRQFLMVTRTMGVIYIIFNLFWGLNYNRPGLVWQLQLDTSLIQRPDLDTLNIVLLQQANAWKRQAMAFPTPIPTGKQLWQETKLAFLAAQRQDTFLHLRRPVIKSSLWGWLGNYTGFLGYYNPFTGEAQVNTTVPAFSQPYTACHELGHQLGYARENEANFVGYLAARASNNPHFRYSMYLDLFLYANRTLARIDSVQAKQFRMQLDTSVKVDLKEWRDFVLAHQNPFEPIVRAAYGVFLRQNQQPAGLLSYDEVTAFLVGYYRKHRRL
jgi:hypothetical protein